MMEMCRMRAGFPIFAATAKTQSRVALPSPRLSVDPATLCRPAAMARRDIRALCRVGAG
jgi:hypothetical protein